MYFLLAGLVSLYEVWKVHKIGPQVWQNYTFSPWAILQIQTKSGPLIYTNPNTTPNPVHHQAQNITPAQQPLCKFK